uniref:CD99 molecule (Xg blood group) n=1 Tax=Salvator merianae TaxID=96440 RepID=A0A8D0EAM0_SALMN
MAKVILFLSLALVLTNHCRGQDFDLGDALGSDPATKPAPTPKKPAPKDDDDFNLGDAVDPNNPQPPPQPPPKPKPESPGNTGDISDADLIDGLPAGGQGGSGGGGGGGGGSGSTENSEGSQGMLAGIVSSVVVAIVGAVSSFIAYQKKKLCFKGSDQENVNMESQQGAHAGQPAQRTLLQK